MINKDIIKHSVAYAAAAILYITVIATLMSYAETIFEGREDAFLAPIGFLSLLVTSAATMGMLVFGKPVMLYIDGKKREGVLMAISTITSLGIFTTLFFVLLVVAQ